MKTRIILFLFCIGIFYACKSSTEPGVSYNFLPLTIGSQWSYSGDIAYKRMVVGDTTVGGKVYAIIDQDNFDANRIPDKYLTKRNYYRKDGNTIYILRPDTMNVLRDFVYVDPSQGASGSYYTLTFIGNFERRITLVSYSNTKQNFRDTIDGKPYANVLIEHIKTEILFPGTSPVVIEGDYYFADGVGLVDQLVTAGTEELTDYLIK